MRSEADSVEASVIADAPAAEGPKLPLVMFSHKRGSNGPWYVG